MAEWRHERPFGDRRAGVGTEEWAKCWRIEFHSAASHLDTNPALVASQYRLGEKYHAWELLTDCDGKPFKSFDAFCEAPPPYGAGVSPKRVRAYITMVEGKEAALQFTASVATPAPTHKDDAATRPRDERGRVKPGPSTSGDAKSGGLDTKQGTTAEYLTARIARDAPAVLERMKAGEFPSVRAAARAAGILKPRDPVRSVVRAVAKLTDEQIRALFAELVARYPGAFE